MCGRFARRRRGSGSSSFESTQARTASTAWVAQPLPSGPYAVVTAVDEYLKPFLLGRDADQIEDIWQAASLSSYWRSGPVLNNALSGVDQALWDIKAKRLGVPLYQLFGGRCRRAADVYVHATGWDMKHLEENVRAHMESGFRYVRCQMDVAGYSTYGVPKKPGPDGGTQSTANYRLALEQDPGSLALMPEWCPGCSTTFAAPWVTT